MLPTLEQLKEWQRAEGTRDPYLGTRLTTTPYGTIYCYLQDCPLCRPPAVKQPTLADVVVPANSDMPVVSELLCHCEKLGCDPLTCKGRCGCRACEEESITSMNKPFLGILAEKQVRCGADIKEEYKRQVGFVGASETLRTECGDEVWHANSNGDVGRYVIVTKYTGGELVLSKWRDRFTVHSREVFATKEEAVNDRVSKLVSQRDTMLTYLNNAIEKLSLSLSASNDHGR